MSREDPDASTHRPDPSNRSERVAGLGSLRVAPARAALALGAGFAVALALPPWGFWPLAFLGVALFEVSLGRAPSRGDRFVLGAAFGAAWLGMGMGWMWQLTVPGYVVAIVIYAVAHGLAALAAPIGVWRVIGRPVAHTLVEAVRFSFPFGGVPLASMGIAQVGGPLGGTARVVGVIGLTWIVFQVGFALAGPAPTVPRSARLVTRSARGRSGGGAPHGLVALGVVVLVVCLAAVAPRGSDTGRSLTVAAVQGGGEQGTTALEVPARLVTERHLEATAGIDPSAFDPPIDLVLWPENVVRQRAVPFDRSDTLAEIGVEAARLGVPITVGITEDADVVGMGAPGQVTNAQVVVTPDGRVTSRYDKVRRVPFGEYVPMRRALEAIGAPVDQVRTNAVAGTDPAVVVLPDGTRLATVISWEVFFPGRAREGVLEGGEAIINPTNGASYTGTIVQTQQVASSRLRAIETGRWLVQAAPTGFTAVVDPDGRVVERSAVSETRVIVRTIELRDGRTWYVRLGEAPFIVAAAAVLGLSWWGARSRRRAAAGTEPDRVTSPATA